MTQPSTVWRCQYRRGFYLITARIPESAIRRILAQKYARNPPLWVARHAPAPWPYTETSDACRERHQNGAVWPAKAPGKPERPELYREAA